ncbi:unnamed protein product, partial [Mesorhabditis belari]
MIIYSTLVMCDSLVTQLFAFILPLFFGRRISVIIFGNLTGFNQLLYFTLLTSFASALFLKKRKDKPKRQPMTITAARSTTKTTVE